jgi:hypothetical protein
VVVVGDGDSRMFMFEISELVWGLFPKSQGDGCFKSAK